MRLYLLTLRCHPRYVSTRISLTANRKFQCVLNQKEHCVIRQHPLVGQPKGTVAKRAGTLAMASRSGPTLVLVAITWALFFCREPVLSRTGVQHSPQGVKKLQPAFCRQAFLASLPFGRQFLACFCRLLPLVRHLFLASCEALFILPPARLFCSLPQVRRFVLENF